MDERHWWMAGKIQESFHIGGGDPALLEDFICQPKIITLINDFFKPGGSQRIFFYCVNQRTDLTINDLHVTSSLAELKDLELEDMTVLYFLKHDNVREVEASHIEKDIFSGELKGNTIETLNSVLGDIFLPLMKAQKSWGSCTTDNQFLLMHNMEKLITTLQDSAANTPSSRQWVSCKLRHKLQYNKNQKRQLVGL